MSPQGQARQWWEGLSDIAKARASGVSLGALGVSAALSLMGYIGLPENDRRQDALLEEHGSRIETHDRRITASDWRLDYTICLLENLSGEGRRTATQCASDFARGPQ